MYSTFEIDPVKHKTELKSIKKLYKISFPPEEKTPWFLIKIRLKRLNLKKYPKKKLFMILLGIRNNEDKSSLLGFAMMNYYKPANFCFASYIAVEPEYRSRGIGSALMKDIKIYFIELSKRLDKELPIGFFYEIEKHDFPKYDEEDRKEIFARYRFYNRFNHKVMETPYFQPSLKPFSPIIPMYLMVSLFKEIEYITKAETIEIYKNIYEGLYYKSHKKVEKLLKILEIDKWPEKVRLLSLESFIHLHP